MLNVVLCRVPFRILVNYGWPLYYIGLYSLYDSYVFFRFVIRYAEIWQNKGIFIGHCLTLSIL